MALKLFSVVLFLAACFQERLTLAEMDPPGFPQPSMTSIPPDDVSMDYQLQCPHRLDDCDCPSMQYQPPSTAYQCFPMMPNQYCPSNLLFSETEWYQGLNRLYQQQISRVLANQPNQMINMDANVNSGFASGHLPYLRPYLFRPYLQPGGILPAPAPGWEGWHCDQFQTYNAPLLGLTHHGELLHESETDTECSQLLRSAESNATISRNIRSSSPDIPESNDVATQPTINATVTDIPILASIDRPEDDAAELRKRIKQMEAQQTKQNMTFALLQAQNNQLHEMFVELQKKLQNQPERERSGSRGKEEHEEYQRREVSVRRGRKDAKSSQQRWNENPRGSDGHRHRHSRRNQRRERDQRRHSGNRRNHKRRDFFDEQANKGIFIDKFYYTN
ncbi:uncharacterized protein LOC135167727 [Diachasmimorpha longicaudata]|uniref:uncharacterized protein LOC135167727 n=1 Tax=Diachasmimorpha longicaudata TaxID=58733 RepID=UPI0030B8DE58